MVGAFETLLFSDHISTFMTREKPDSSTRRTIIDLSWSKVQSVNDGVENDSYLGIVSELHNPDLVQRLNALGTVAKIFNIDIGRPFRDRRIYPGDIDLLAGFFSFVRFSNILTYSLAKFYTSRHLSVVDIVFSDNGAVVIVKWSKIMQDRQHIGNVPIPQLGNAYICPVKALNLMLSQNPMLEMLLFFTFQVKVELCHCDSLARKHLKSSFCQYINLSRRINFHGCRRGGATWTFWHGFRVEHIQVQGTWSSQCMWGYIKLPPSSSSVVYDTFRTFLHY